MQGSKLYVGNISYSVREDQLRELFSQHGEVKDVVIIKDSMTERSKGFGFVEMSIPAEVQQAIEALNGTEFESRPRPQGDNRRGGFRDRY